MASISHFYAIVRDEYDKLFPDKALVLATLTLLENYSGATGPEQEFDHETLINAIAEAEINIGEKPFYNEKEPKAGHYNNRVRKLLEHFITREIRTGKYHFTAYARQIELILKEELEGHVDTGRVASIFRTLRKDLNDNTLEYWLKATFSAMSAGIYQQLMTFDDEINRTLRQLANPVKTSEEAFLEKLSVVKEALDHLDEQAKSLANAFEEGHEIKAAIIKKLEESDNESLEPEVDKVLGFFTLCRQKLGSASDRLERVKPRVSALIGNLAKLRFDRSTELFIDLLLDHDHKAPQEYRLSTLRKAVLLQARPKMTFLHRNTRLFPLPKVRYQHNSIDTRLVEAKRMEAMQMRWVRGRVDFYLFAIMNQVSKEGRLDFTSWALQIIHTEGDQGQIILKLLLSCIFRQNVVVGKMRVIVTEERNNLKLTDPSIYAWTLYLEKPKTL